MDNSQIYSSISCEIQIIRARNVEQIRSLGGCLFVRCYLSAGEKQRVQIKTQEILSKSDLSWNESFSLDCLGTGAYAEFFVSGVDNFKKKRCSKTHIGAPELRTPYLPHFPAKRCRMTPLPQRCICPCLGNEESINMLKQGSVVFELRSRKVVPVFGKVGGSKIMGRAEVPWRSVFESKNMEIVEWAIIMDSKKRNLHEDVKPMAVQISMKVGVKETKKVQKNDNTMDKCGCNSTIFSAEDNEVFALGAALDAL
uniref:Uncharacterized protein LOC104226976 n=1 Tax=Nicotiana sylvestris TaxID=4096 RepID=A0A1U7WRU1_NICSY|nr:PREDICTED: uncharacterized protein LOC104226976 [Nicotiana sylvestris]